MPIGILMDKYENKKELGSRNVRINLNVTDKGTPFSLK
jgi:hypothetical protein